MTNADRSAIPRRSPSRSRDKVRSLDAKSLGLLESQETSPVSPSISTGAPGTLLSTNDTINLLQPRVSDNDSRLIEVQRLLSDGYAGVIFTGPPGTSKSWYAEQIAAKLVDGDPNRVRFIQFHASYQYEDFIEGFVPGDNGRGFTLKPKHLLDMCDIARAASGETCVLVIDELSRCDPARVFGEALTYIEMTRRDKTFYLASGRSVSIPRNLVFLATMNPQDRGVDEVDAALERRFAKIAMDPDRTILLQFLDDNGVDERLCHRVVRFFDQLQRRGELNPSCRIGQTYFLSVEDEASLGRLWDHQLRFLLEKAYRLDMIEFKAVEAEWKRIFTQPAGPQEAEDGDTTPTTP